MVKILLYYISAVAVLSGVIFFTFAFEQNNLPRWKYNKMQEIAKSDGASYIRKTLGQRGCIVDFHKLNENLRSKINISPIKSYTSVPGIVSNDVKKSIAIKIDYPYLELFCENKQSVERIASFEAFYTSELKIVNLW